MLNDNAKKWVAALRSGKYEQGRGALCKNGKYCCLGVACEVAIESGLEVSKDINPNAEIGTVGYMYNDKSGLLPIPVMNWLNLATSSGVYYDSILVDDNDEWKKTFAEIADIIESEPKGLFNE